MSTVALSEQPPADQLEELLTEEQVAKIIKVETTTLARWRREKRPCPRSIPFGSGKIVRYLKSDVVAYLNGNKQGPLSVGVNGEVADSVTGKPPALDRRRKRKS